MNRVSGQVCARGAMVVAVSLGAMCAGSMAVADPTISYGGYTWTIDRWEPTEVGGISAYMGRDDVLRVLLGEDGFASNRPPDYSSTFFNYQGIKTEVNVAGFPAFGTADLYIPESWHDPHTVPEVNFASLWGSVYEPGTSGFDYPVIGFANHNADGRFRVLEGASYTELTDVPVLYDDWNTIRFEINEDTYDFFVNGELVYSLEATEDPNAFLKEIFLHGYNNGTTEYEIFWSNVMAGMLVSAGEASTGAGPTTLSTFSRIRTIGDFASRRGVQPMDSFVPQNDTWGRTGAFGGDFDIDGGTLDGNGVFLQGGIDVFEPKPGLALGVMGQYGRTGASDDIGGTLETEGGGLGVYVNYANDRGYLDVLATAGHEEWSVTTIAGSGSTNAVTYVASVEAGYALDIAPRLRLVPNGQIMLTGADADDLTFGGLVADYSADTSAFGRAGARLEFSVAGIGLEARGFVGASAIGRLAGDSDTVVSGAALPGGNDIVVGGGLDEVAFDLTGGIDVRVNAHTRLFGEAGAQLGGGTDVIQGSGGVAVEF